MGSALRFKHQMVPRQNGELARLKVVKGPDYGTVFVLTASRATLGRGDENDIVVSDLKSSRLHAEVVQGPKGWRVRDLGSANGILYNDKATTSAELKPHDTVSFGETTLEFFPPEVETSALVAPPREMIQIQAEQSNFSARQSEVRKMAGSISLPASNRASGPTGAGSSQQKNLILLMGGLALVAFLFFFDDGKRASQKQAKRKAGESRDLASYLPESQLLVQDKTAEIFFRSGFREYRERNYLRAKSNFETVLQIAPGHSLARLYLDHCEQEIKSEVKYHLDIGKRSLDSGKIKKARGHFEAVLRLLFRDPQNAQYLEAKEQLEAIEKAKRGEGS